MFCITLQGGLGNQLFQYAFGQMLAKRYDTQVLYDDLNYSNLSIFSIGCMLGLYTPRQLQIERFDIKINRPTRIQRFQLGSTGFHKILKKIGYHNPYNKDETQGYHYDITRMQLDPTQHYLCTGYRNVAKYYENLPEGLRSRIQLRSTSKVFENYKKEILSQQKSGIQTVSIHIRGGDYIKLGMIVCDEKYYTTALQQLAEKFGKEFLHIWLFSDDPDNLPMDIGFLKEYKFTHIIFDDYYTANKIDQQGFDDVEKFFLMSQCRHHIIANSTYSRWSARLGDKEGITFAPTMRLKNVDSTEVVPQEWRRI